MADAAELFARQDTALIVAVPEAEDAVAEWRQLHDASAALGVPAHVTILFPWIPNLRITDEDLAELKDLCAGFDAFDARFPSVEDRGDIVWMRPEPEQPFRALTAAVWKRWPEFPPYGGQHEDVIPHLTIADRVPEQVTDAIVASIRTLLPIMTRVNEIELIAFEDGTWGVREVFYLGA